MNKNVLDCKCIFVVVVYWKDKEKRDELEYVVFSTMWTITVKLLLEFAIMVSIIVEYF